MKQQINPEETKVTIGIGAFSHISKANARLVSCGLISCFIFFLQKSQFILYGRGGGKNIFYNHH